jgi:hypothetical protein
VLKNCGGVELAVRRGVKQGDPLSSLLFNLVLDPLLDLVSDLEYGFRIDDQPCSVLAFADDLCLLFKSPEGLQRGMDCVSST